MKNKKRKICNTISCSNYTLENRVLCPKCRSKEYKRKYPLHYWFNILRSNARRRGKKFTLSFCEFEMFCKKTGYIEKKGKTATSLSIDRINPMRGYTKENIRAISLSDNTRLAKGSIIDPGYTSFNKGDVPH